MEEKKSKTQAIIETIGQEKAVVDQAVEAGREDEEAASKLAVSLSGLPQALPIMGCQGICCRSEAPFMHVYDQQHASAFVCGLQGVRCTHHRDVDA